MTKFLIAFVLSGVFVPPLWAETIRWQWVQSDEAITTDQRLVGNVAAQAKREGVILDVPQLFIYYRDFSPAYHLAGYRPTLIDEINLVINSHRLERSMVKLERLLERARWPDGRTPRLEDLPPAQLYVLLYTHESCALCTTLQSSLEPWLLNRDQSVVWIEIDVGDGV